MLGLEQIYDLQVCEIIMDDASYYLQITDASSCEITDIR